MTAFPLENMIFRKEKSLKWGLNGVSWKVSAPRIIGKFYVALFTVLLLLCLMPPFSVAAAPVVLNGPEVYVPASNLSILRDPDGALAIGDVVGSEIRERFKPNHFIGWSHDAVWYRLTIQNPSDTPRESYLQIMIPWIFQIDFFVPDGRGGFAQTRSGAGVLRKEWKIDKTLPAFQVSLSPNETKTVYMRVINEGQIQMPVVIMDKAILDWRDHFKEIIMAVFVGASAVMLFYNLLIYASLRDHTYLFYVLYVASVMLTVFSLRGFGFQYLWPESVLLGSRSSEFLPNFFEISGVLFARSFLSTSQRLPRLDRVLKGYIVLHLVYLTLVLFWPSSLFAPAAAFTDVMPGVLSLLLLATGIKALMQGNRAARYFVLSISFTIAGMSWFMLALWGLVHFDFAADNTIEAGFLLEIITLSLALADRVKEKDKIKDLLGKVVSHKVAEELLHKKVELGGELREISVMFVDIRGFSTHAEGMNPKEVLSFLNIVFTKMSGIIEENGGVVDKYIGDAIMALFGAPLKNDDDADRALNTAIQIHAAIKSINGELEARGMPKVDVGIGINTEVVVVGNMGSMNRMNYTAIGDGVNLASRLQELTREERFGTKILISHRTFSKANGKYATRNLGIVNVKGKSEPTAIYALFGTAN